MFIHQFSIIKNHAHFILFLCSYFIKVNNNNSNKNGEVLIVTLRRKPNRFEHNMLQTVNYL